MGAATVVSTVIFIASLLVQVEEIGVRAEFIACKRIRP